MSTRNNPMKRTNNAKYTLTGVNKNEFHRLEIGIYSLSKIPTVFWKILNQIFNSQTPVWLDGILVVTRGNKEKHRTKLFTIIWRARKAVNSACEKKPGFVLIEKTWLWH